MNEELVIGIHSVVEAILNPQRENLRLIVTEEGLKELRSQISNEAQERFKNIEKKTVTSHVLQQMGEKYFKENELAFSRIPGGVLLFSSPLAEYDLNWLFGEIKSKRIQKILCLDQVTDVHNVGAILRTASFYGVGAVLSSNKKRFTSNPNFSRIASGAIEHVPLVRCSSLVKAVEKFEAQQITCVGLSEHATSTFESIELSPPVALFLGAEEVGLSHALTRVLKNKVSMKPFGKTQSLNVSVAAAVAMEKIFGRNLNRA